MKNDEKSDLPKIKQILKLPDKRSEVLFIPNAVKCEPLIEFDQEVGQHVSMDDVIDDPTTSSSNSGIIRTEIVVENDPDAEESDTNGDGFQILLEAAELGGE